MVVQGLIRMKCEDIDKMAEENIHDPTRSDDQLVPVKAHLPYGKSNLLLDIQKPQKNLIFCISEFWNTLTQEAKSGVYSFQLDEQWFPLNADLLREALEITHVDPAHPFVSPLRVNRPLEVTNPDTLLFKCCGGIVTGSNVDYAKLLWEEFVQGIQTFFSHRASLSIPSKKPTPHVIFTADSS
ncbi:hypothetical protein Tco_0227845 [Tanacetum coccineum]